MKLSKNLKRTFGCTLLLLASLLLGGCEHLYYADPNPEKPFAFPNQPTGAPMAATPSNPASVPGPALAAPINASYAPGGISSMPATPLPPATGGTSSPQSTGSASILQKGDMVSVTFSDIPLPGMPEVKQRIPDDGKLSLPLDVNVQA